MDILRRVRIKQARARIRNLTIRQASFEEDRAYSELRTDSRKKNCVLTWLQNMSACSAGHKLIAIYSTSRCGSTNTLHYITLHYITLHYITFTYIYVYISVA